MYTVRGSVAQTEHAAELAAPHNMNDTANQSKLVPTESGGPGVASTLRRPFPGGIGSGS